MICCNTYASGQDGRGEQVLDLDRQFAHAHAGGVIGRGGDGGGDAGQADLADPAGAEFVDLLVGVIEEMHVDRRDVSVHRHHVVGEVAVDGRAVPRVVMRVLQQRHADSHHDRAFDLVPAGEWIEECGRHQ